MKRNLGLLSRGHNLLSKQGLKNVYYAHIYSHMSYCISIWGSMISSELLYKLGTQQNQCICMLDTRLLLTDLCRKYKIMSIDDVMFKLNNDMLPVNLLASLKGDARDKTLTKEHNYNTRNKRELNLPMTENSKYHSSLFQAIKRYSKLPHALKGCTTYGTFVRKLKDDYFQTV